MENKQQIASNSVQESASAKPTKAVIGKNFFSVLVTVAGIILLLVIISLFLFAKTGLVKVPLFSKLYNGPEPTRLVESNPIDETSFRLIVSKRILKEVQDGKTPYSFKLSEEELTGALVSVMHQALRDQAWDIDKTQIVVNQESIEFYGVFHKNNLHVDIKANFIPIVEDGGIRFVADYVKFGDFPLHPGLANRIAGQIFERDFGTWVIKFGDIRFDKVVLKNGIMEIFIK